MTITIPSKRDTNVPKPVTLWLDLARQGAGDDVIDPEESSRAGGGADELVIVGPHTPRFRGDTEGRLAGGAVWAIFVGGFGIAMSFRASAFWIPLIFTLMCWSSAVFLVRRWTLLRAGVELRVGTEGFGQAPRSRRVKMLEPWRSGLEITFYNRRGEWSLQIVDGTKRLVSMRLPGWTENEVGKLRSKLEGWQSNRVFVEMV